MNVGAPRRKDKGTQKGFVVCEYEERTGGPGERTVITSSSVGVWLFRAWPGLCLDLVNCGIEVGTWCQTWL